MTILPARIREARILRGLTQDALAAKMKTTQDYMSMFENGRAEPNPERARKLCKALGVTLAMLEGTEPLPGDRDVVVRRTSTPDPTLEAERQASRDRMAKRDRGELPTLGTPLRIPGGLEEGLAP